VDSFKDHCKLSLYTIHRGSKLEEACNLPPKIGKTETLNDFMVRLNKEKLSVDDHDESVVFATLLRGIWSRSPFIKELAQRTPPLPSNNS
jgi:hypothetical protein